MIYIDRTPLDGTGRSKLWRVFAASTSELQRALDGSPADWKDQGGVGEHVVVSTTVKNRLVGSEGELASNRQLVKLIKSKRLRLEQEKADPVAETLAEAFSNVASEEVMDEETELEDAEEADLVEEDWGEAELENPK